MTREQFEDLAWDYEYIGIRVQKPEFTEGEKITHASKVWVDGEETDEDLDGVCALWVQDYDMYDKILERAKSGYFGDHMAILVAEKASYGEDDGEIVMKDPIVWKVLS